MRRRDWTQLFTIAGAYWLLVLWLVAPVIAWAFLVVWIAGAR